MKKKLNQPQNSYMRGSHSGKEIAMDLVRL